MKKAFRFKGMYPALAILVLIPAVIVVIQYPEFLGNNSSTTEKADQPAYQTGKAFEVLEPDANQAKNNPLSGKSADQLILEADQIVAVTNQLIAEKGLTQTALTPEQKEQIDENIKKLEQQIAELERQLK